MSIAVKYFQEKDQRLNWTLDMFVKSRMKAYMNNDEKLKFVLSVPFIIPYIFVKSLWWRKK